MFSRIGDQEGAISDPDNNNNNNNNNKVLKNAFYNTWKSRCFLRYLPNLTINTVKKKSV